LPAPLLSLPTTPHAASHTCHHSYTPLRAHRCHFTAPLLLAAFVCWVDAFCPFALRRGFSDGWFGWDSMAVVNLLRKRFNGAASPPGTPLPQRLGCNAERRLPLPARCVWRAVTGRTAPPFRLLSLPVDMRTLTRNILQRRCLKCHCCDAAGLRAYGDSNAGAAVRGRQACRWRLSPRQTCRYQYAYYQHYDGVTYTAPGGFCYRMPLRGVDDRLLVVADVPRRVVCRHYAA